MKTLEAEHIDEVPLGPLDKSLWLQGYVRELIRLALDLEPLTEYTSHTMLFKADKPIGQYLLGTWSDDTNTFWTDVTEPSNVYFFDNSSIPFNTHKDLCDYIECYYHKSFSEYLDTMTHSLWFKERYPDYGYDLCVSDNMIYPKFAGLER